MTALLTIIFPIFALIGLGFGLTRGGLFSPADMRVFGKFTLNVALPALMFSALATRDFSEVVNPTYLVVATVAGLVMIAGGMLWFGRTGLARAQAAAATMGTVCPNSGFIAYPLTLLAFPQVAVPVLAMNVLVENLLVIPILLALMGKRGGAGGVWPMLAALAADLARRPLIIALVAGLALSLAGVALPEPVARVLAMLGAATGPVALIAIGGGLAGLSVRGQHRLAAQIVAGKLILHPVIVLGVLAAAVALGMAPLDPATRAGLLITAAVPAMSIYPIFAQEAGMEGVASLATLAGVAVSVVTLSLLLLALG